MSQPVTSLYKNSEKTSKLTIGILLETKLDSLPFAANFTEDAKLFTFNTLFKQVKNPKAHVILLFAFFYITILPFDECVWEGWTQLAQRQRGDFCLASNLFLPLTPTHPHLYAQVITSTRLCKHNRQHSCTTYIIIIKTRKAKWGWTGKNQLTHILRYVSCHEVCDNVKTKWLTVLVILYVINMEFVCFLWSH